MRKILLVLVGIATVISTSGVRAAPQTLERLRAQIRSAIPAAQGVVGVAIRHLETGEQMAVNGDEPFPMASTFKLPVLVELHAKARAGALDWEELADIGPRDQHLGSGDLAYLYDPPGIRLSIRNVANLMMIVSDNSAADFCLARATAAATNARMRSLGIQGIRVDRSCQELILDYGGRDTARLKDLALDDLRKAMASSAPRDPQTEETRFRADDAFAADPRDTATPLGFVALLDKIWRGEAVDRAASDAMLALLKRCRTGEARIKGLLPRAAVVAHKTGTIGGVVNDVGIMYLPGGAGHVAIAVMSKKTRAPSDRVERTIAEIARSAYDYFYFTVPATSTSTSSMASAERWWSHVKFLADDEMKGRETGSAEHRKAAEYVAAQFRAAGLEPGAGSGYIQPVKFTSRRSVEEQSSLALVRPRAPGPGPRTPTGEAPETVPIELGEEATFNMRVNPAARIEAPLVFAGYGLTVPEVGHDDLAGLDLKGKVVVLLTGGPSNIPGPLFAHYQAARWQYLKRAGAIGVIGIQNPKGADIPWDRSKLSRFMPQLTLADPALDETAGQRLAVTFNPAKAEKLFEGSGHTFAELLALSDAGKVLPTFALPASVKAVVTTRTEAIESQNVAGILRGGDPALRNQYVVLSAHLDHVGVGQPINGDRIYNGAMDNASGIATLIETAAAIKEQGVKLRRSIVFLAVTAEEKGLLGSRYFAAHPTVPSGAIVANLNTDMFLPLFPMKSIIAQGLGESDLTADLERVAAKSGMAVLADPEPERNAFIRSDQYSFIKRGVPALSLKVGFTRGSPEHDLVRRWRTERYHAPSDDLNQPVDLGAAVDFGRVYLMVVEAVANRESRPAWNATSFFKRFAPTAARGTRHR